MHPLLAITIACWLALPPAALGYSPTRDLGFQGPLIVEFLRDGRSLRVLEEFNYVDGTGRDWIVPAGSVVNGASIPRAAWSIVGGPLTGKYREASVIHDVHCERRERPWQEVHRVFYEAMLESGMDEVQSKIIYAAVYMFGPRWDLPLAAAAPCDPSGEVPCARSLGLQPTAAATTQPFDETLFEEVAAFIEGENPSIATLDGFAEAALERHGSW